jgi:hypothetical protein
LKFPNPNRPYSDSISQWPTWPLIEATWLYRRQVSEGGPHDLLRYVNSGKGQGGIEAQQCVDRNGDPAFFYVPPLAAISMLKTSGTRRNAAH